MGKRGWVVVAVAAAVTVSAAGGALAYVNAGSAVLTDVPTLMTYCADRQREVAGITALDEAGTTNGGHAYSVVNHVYENTATLPGAQNLPEGSTFVQSKSGIQYDVSNPALPVRRILTGQYVEYADAGRTQPMQVRCKMRSLESLNRPETDKQKLDNGTVTSVPWGFGAGTASGVGAAGSPLYANGANPALDQMKPCGTTNAETLAAVWAGLSEAEKDAAVFRPEARGASPANIVVDPDTIKIAGAQWTAAWNPAQTTTDGTLHIQAASLYSESTNTSGAPDRFLGSFYCTYAVADYLRAVMLGTVVPPAAP